MDAKSHGRRKSADETLCTFGVILHINSFVEFAQQSVLASKESIVKHAVALASRHRDLPADFSTKFGDRLTHELAATKDQTQFVSAVSLERLLVKLLIEQGIPESWLADERNVAWGVVAECMKEGDLLKDAKLVNGLAESLFKLHVQVCMDGVTEYVVIPMGETMLRLHICGLHLQKA